MIVRHDGTHLPAVILETMSGRLRVKGDGNKTLSKTGRSLLEFVSKVLAG